MTQRKITKIASYFILLLLLAGAFTQTAFANSAEPPTLTVIVYSPPDDLVLSLRFADGSISKPVQLQKDKKMWETYYRFYYAMMYPIAAQERPSLISATFIVQSSEKSFECPFPESESGIYNNLLTLDIENESIVRGQSLTRSILLVALRVVLTLLIEGLIFFGFGYRRKVSWIVFIAANLFTQIALNVELSGPNLGLSYWFLGFMFYEILIIAAEMIIFSLALKEQKQGRAVACAAVANICSLILGGILISSLPV